MRIERRGLGNLEREIHATDDCGAELINVVGDPDRWGFRCLDQAVHERLAATPPRGIAIVDAEKQVVGFIDDENRPSPNCADGGANHESADAFAAARLGVFVIDLAHELDGEAEMSSKRLGEFCLAGAGRSVEKQVGPKLDLGSWLARCDDDPSGEVAQLAEVFEIGPSECRSSRFSEQKFGDVTRAEPRHREDSASDMREARGASGVDEPQFC